ncbi:dCTP deaminase/dUTPase family protein [Enterococcus sp. N249-2]
MRKFAVAKGFEENKVNLPKRATKYSAGYDFESAEDITIPSFWKTLMANFLNGDNLFKPVIVKTGIKAYMKNDEVLFLYPRSSNSIKRFLIMPNSVGVIDSDYVDNDDNDGSIGVPLWNFGSKPVHIVKGERIAQGIFTKFYVVDDDDAEDKAKRSGGFGHTGIGGTKDGIL